MPFEHYKHKFLKCLYRITLNDKKYIGQTKNTTNRFSKHRNSESKCRYINNAIQLYGWENATVDILLIDLTKEEADRLETHYIDILRTLAPNGYNLNKGGDCHEWSDEAREAQSERMKVVCDTPEFREAKSELMKKLWEDPKFVEANTQRLKDLWTDDAREVQSEKMKTQWEDEEYRQKRSEDQSKHMRERWDDEQSRKKLTISQQERYAKEEEREKARKSHAHMRKFTDEELIEKNKEFKGSVEKLCKHFEISACVICRHKKRLGLTRTRTKSRNS
jgi:hypothetical protein